MNKEIYEAWNKIEEYLMYCFGYTNTCEAIRYTDTPTFLEPYIKKVKDFIQLFMLDHSINVEDIMK